jgi:maltodextrin utilization protein YvdJ
VLSRQNAPVNEASLVIQGEHNVTVQISYPPNQIDHQTKENHKSTDGRSYDFYMENHLYCSGVIIKAVLSLQQSVRKRREKRPLRANWSSFGKCQLKQYQQNA